MSSNFWLCQLHIANSFCQDPEANEDSIFFQTQHDRLSDDFKKKYDSFYASEVYDALQKTKTVLLAVDVIDHTIGMCVTGIGKQKKLFIIDPLRAYNKENAEIFKKDVIEKGNIDKNNIFDLSWRQQPNGRDCVLYTMWNLKILQILLQFGVPAEVIVESNQSFFPRLKESWRTFLRWLFYANILSYRDVIDKTNEYVEDLVLVEKYCFVNGASAWVEDRKVLFKMFSAKFGEERSEDWTKCCRGFCNNEEKFKKEHKAWWVKIIKRTHDSVKCKQALSWRGQGRIRARFQKLRDETGLEVSPQDRIDFLNVACPDFIFTMQSDGSLCIFKKTRRYKQFLQNLEMLSSAKDISKLICEERMIEGKMTRVVSRPSAFARPNDVLLRLTLLQTLEGLSFMASDEKVAKQAKAAIAAYKKLPRVDQASFNNQVPTCFDGGNIKIVKIPPANDTLIWKKEAKKPEAKEEKNSAPKEDQKELPLASVQKKTSKLDKYSDIELTQPKPDKNGKWQISEGANNVDHSWEAACIFLETQLKRILRLIFGLFTDRYNYFSDNENKYDGFIYKKDDPLPYFDRDGEINIQNISHASQLIQTHGINILTDPAFSDLDSFLYPAKTELGVVVENLPVLDVILITHNHRDHMDFKTLKKIAEKQTDKAPTIIVPMGDGEKIRALGFQNVHEANWFEEFEVTKGVKKVVITTTPVDHWTNRGAFDKNQSLANSYVITPEQGKGIVYFAGDTAVMSESRMKSIAAILHMQIKANKLREGYKIFNLEPGGPNYNRKDMKSTHQSAVESVISAFRFAKYIYEIDQKIPDSEEKPKAKEWLEKMLTIFIRQNKYELGPDRFNENLRIYQELIDVIEHLDDAEIQELIKHESQKGFFERGFINYDKRFIYQGALELKKMFKEIIGVNESDNLDSEKCDKLVLLLKEKVKFPLIGESLFALHM